MKEAKCQCGNDLVVSIIKNYEAVVIKDEEHFKDWKDSVGQRYTEKELEDMEYPCVLQVHSYADESEWNVWCTECGDEISNLTELTWI